MYDDKPKSVVHRNKWRRDGEGPPYVYSRWVLEYDQYEYPKNLDMVCDLIRTNLEPKFCPLRFREINKTNPLFGHCVHATQALYYFFADKNLTKMSAPCQGPAEFHWWLQDGNKIIDVTAGQYDHFDFDPPYEKGKVMTKWLGYYGRPHKKTLELMKKIQKNSQLYLDLLK